MAKFQLCMFQRTEEDQKKNNWERGIARVKEFGLSDIHFVLTESGEKIEEPWNYRLLRAYAHMTIDTNMEATF